MTIVIPRSASARVLAVAEELPVGEEPPGISRLELVGAPKQVLLPKTLSPMRQIIPPAPRPGPLLTACQRDRSACAETTACGCGCAERRSLRGPDTSGSPKGLTPAPCCPHCPVAILSYNIG